MKGDMDISIHPPRVGRARNEAITQGQNYVFQSTLPVWGGTSRKAGTALQTVLFQSTLPVWGGTAVSTTSQTHTIISIHPPRVGRDDCQTLEDHYQAISIHPPRVGRDLVIIRSVRWRLHFNPPSPCGEGPCCSLGGLGISPDFNPPSPCGEGRITTERLRPSTYFNPPSPCGEGRPNHPRWRLGPQYFNPPSPCGEGHGGLCD